MSRVHPGLPRERFLRTLYDETAVARVLLNPVERPLAVIVCQVLTLIEAPFSHSVRQVKNPKVTSDASRGRLAR